MPYGTGPAANETYAQTMTGPRQFAAQRAAYAYSEAQSTLRTPSTTATRRSQTTAPARARAHAETRDEILTTTAATTREAAAWPSSLTSENKWTRPAAPVTPNLGGGGLGYFSAKDAQDAMQHDMKAFAAKDIRI